jgi:hypothetical protein
MLRLVVSNKKTRALSPTTACGFFSMAAANSASGKEFSRHRQELDEPVIVELWLSCDLVVTYHDPRR